jgi:hypothetical protein
MAFNLNALAIFGRGPLGNTHAKKYYDVFESSRRRLMKDVKEGLLSK